MHLTSLDNLHQQADFGDMRQNSRRVTLLIPVLVNVSLDTDMQTGLDVSSGDGTGRTVSRWNAYEIQAFIQPVTQNLITFGQVPPGVETGDVIFHTQLRDDEAIKEAYGNQYHYIYLDSETFRIVSLAFNDTGQRQTRICGCKHYTPSTFRCTGY